MHGRRFKVRLMTLAQSPPHSPANPGLIRNDWTRAEVRALFALPFPELMFEAARIHRMHFDPSEVQISTLLVDQDRRLPRGLRLLPAERQIRHRRRRRKADEPRRGAGRGARRQGRRRQPLLHGRGLALAEGPRRRECLRDGGGRQGAGARDLRHARHAHAGAGGAAEAQRPRLLQPQPRHLAGVSTARSSPPAPTRIGSTRSARCATPASTSAAAASSAWGRARRIAPA